MTSPRSRKIHGLSKSPSQWLLEFRNVHGNRFGYEKSTFGNSKTKISISCPDHGLFKQTPEKHKAGQGCPTCADLTRKESKRSRMASVFIQKSRHVHGETYTYENFSYTHHAKKGLIGCPQHGEFEQTPNAHLNGQGCPTCGRNKTTLSHRLSHEEFVIKATQEHDSRYQYPDRYLSAKQKLKIVCPTHGPFHQTPDSHIFGKSGCPDCAREYQTNTSIQETDLISFISSLLPSPPLRHSRIPTTNLQLDAYIPSHRLGIEYCGLYWHSEKFKTSNYHRIKFDKSMDNQIRLITIFEDEWMNRTEQVKNYFIRLFRGSIPGVGARKISLSRIDYSEASTFLDRYHIQGKVANAVFHLGGFTNEKLISVASFRRSRTNQTLELVRFCTDNRSHPGLLSKICHHVSRETGEMKILSYVDLRWFTGESYLTNGFILDGEVRPTYSYVRNGLRYHKSSIRKTSVSERETAKIRNAYRIYDCGKLRMIWKNHS